jgi:hypothetical protein
VARTRAPARSRQDGMLIAKTRRGFMRSAIVASLVVASVLTVSAQPVVPTKWVHIEGSPIKMLAPTPKQAQRNPTIVFVNQSNKVIEAAVMATAIIPASADVPTEWVRRELPSPIMPIKPAILYSMYGDSLTRTRFDEAKRKHGTGFTTETAFVEVRYADGTKWAFDTTGRRSISTR